MKLVLLSVIVLCSAAFGLEIYHVIFRNNGFINEANDTLDDKSAYRLVDPEVTVKQLEENEIVYDDTPVAIMSIDSDGKVNCSIVNNL